MSFSKWVLAVSVAATPWACVRAAEPALPLPPMVQPSSAREIAPGITVIPDPRIPFVPNVGIVEGRDAILVIDTGLGPANGRRIWEFARQRASGRTVYLTTTHFHPEHSFGAEAFAPEARYVTTAAQARERAEKGRPYIELFRTFGPEVAKGLEGTALSPPDETFESSKTLDLGGRTVQLLSMPAHTRGDEVVYVPDVGVAFLGDLVENRFFPIMPDTDSKGAGWIAVTHRLEALSPRIVVPGHGEIAGPELIRATRDSLERTRDLVHEGIARRQTQEQIATAAATSLQKHYPDWDNANFIPFQVAIFFAEATGQPPKMPGF